MELVLPAIPAAVTVLLNFFAPYAIAVVVSPEWPTKLKKFAAVIVAVVLAALVLVFAFWLGLAVPAWPTLFLIAIATAQASYDLILKKSANKLAAVVGTGKHIAQ